MSKIRHATENYVNNALQGVGGGAIQSDYSQNDSSQPDYIKNKPCYIENDILLVRCDSDNLGTHHTSVELKDGDTISIKISGSGDDVYGLTDMLNLDDDGTLRTEGGIGIGDEFVIEVFYNPESNELYVSGWCGEDADDLPEGLIIELRKKGEIVHQLDEKFIPDTIARKSDIQGEGGSTVQSDYNQNDSTQPDYIKNRPCYVDDVLIANEPFVPTDLDYFNWIDLSPADLRPGDTVCVKLIGYRDSASVVFKVGADDNGNWELIHEQAENLNDYVVAEADGTQINVWVGEEFPPELFGVEAHIEIYKTDVVHPLDEKFIPDTIARKEDIGDIETSLENIIAKYGLGGDA